MNWKAHGHMHCKCGDISETVQHKRRFDYLAIRIPAIAMTLCDLQGYSPITSHLKLDFSYNCAAVGKISYHHIYFCSKVNDNTITIWQTPTCSNRARRTRLRWSTYCRLQIKMKTAAAADIVLCAVHLR